MDSSWWILLYADFMIQRLLDQLEICSIHNLFPIYLLHFLFEIITLKRFLAKFHYVGCKNKWTATYYAYSCILKVSTKFLSPVRQRNSKRKTFFIRSFPNLFFSYVFEWRLKNQFINFIVKLGRRLKVKN